MQHAPQLSVGNSLSTQPTTGTEMEYVDNRIHETRKSTFAIPVTSSGIPERKRLSHACDRCRSRKVKCDLRRPTCANCEIRSLHCEFFLPSRKRGRKRRAENVPHDETYVSHGQERQTSPTASSSRSLPATVEVRSASIPNLLSQDGLTPVTNHQWSPPSNPSPYSNTPGSIESILNQASDIGTIICDLGNAINQEDSSQSLSSLLIECVDAFFNNLYPVMPFIYKPHIDSAISQIRNQDWSKDSSLLTLLTSVCAVTIAILPKTVFRARAEFAVHFYCASRAALNTYFQEDLEKPNSSSIIIRYLHAEYHHATGRMRSSWHTLGDAIRICQTLRLHEESSYARMAHPESEICRRIFYLLFVGDKSASILSNHPAVLAASATDTGVTALHPSSLGEIDSIPNSEDYSDDDHVDILTGFNSNYELWRSAYELLKEIERLRERFLTQPPFESFQQPPTQSDISKLTGLYLAFQTSLDNLPGGLQAYPMVFASRNSIGFEKRGSINGGSKALAIQRANLQISFQCLRMVVLHAMPALADSTSQLWTATDQNPSSTTKINPKVFESAKEVRLGTGESSALLLQKINIAESMLHIVCSCELDDLRINGEACVAKIRLIGATMLELIDNHPNSPLVRTAQNFRNWYPQILAHLDSKTSDGLQ